jgi:hypothetical protein
VKQPTNDAGVGSGSFEGSAFDRVDIRVLLPERPDVDPMRHPSAWLSGGDADLPDPLGAL